MLTTKRVDKSGSYLFGIVMENETKNVAHVYRDGKIAIFGTPTIEQVESYIPKFKELLDQIATA